MNRRALLLIAVALVATVAVLGGYKYWRVTQAIAAGAAFANPAEAVSVAVAHPIRWQLGASAPGTVVAREFVILSNELPGTVARVAFRSGEVVEAGQVLLELDTRSERAELRSAEADITLARLTAERTRKLVEQRAGTQAEVDRAEAQLAQAEARRDVIATTIQRRTLRAPFRGRIGLRDVHPGQYLAAGTELTTLESVADSVFIDFRLQQEVAAQLAPGTELHLSGAGLPAGATAVIRAIDARADEASRTVRV
ncbi:MAG: efflux RND transporter periplasmic adaptor subunit, partial [Gammaproteobacteria bacterium PRO8]|nr:efflux RND transporter periplasmic adaptor subunit [Gammaproteobacteria bacterium PRO8]